MMGRIEEISQRSMARTAGVFEALEGLASASGQVFILGRIVIAGDAAVPDHAHAEISPGAGPRPDPPRI